MREQEVAHEADLDDELVGIRLGERAACVEQRLFELIDVLLHALAEIVGR